MNFRGVCCWPRTKHLCSKKTREIDQNLMVSGSEKTVFAFFLFLKWPSVTFLSSIFIVIKLLAHRSKVPTWVPFTFWPRPNRSYWLNYAVNHSLRYPPFGTTMVVVTWRQLLVNHITDTLWWNELCNFKDGFHMNNQVIVWLLFYCYMLHAFCKQHCFNVRFVGKCQNLYN